MERKYELTDDRVRFIYHGQPIFLYRIRALRDIQGGLVRTGDLGGYIESEANLSQQGECWVGREAHVYGNAYICENALVNENAVVQDEALIFGKAVIMDHAFMRDQAKAGQSAVVSDYVSLSGQAQVMGHQVLMGRTMIHDKEED